MTSFIDFSAQYGGRDAATAVMPHFKALKAAAHGLRLEGFPFPELSYILRVDGEISQYQLSGAGNIEIDAGKQYLSVDIGIERGDRNQIVKVICDAILSSAEQIEDLALYKRWNVDFNSLRECLLDLTTRYKCDLPRKVES
jgi:hypothetical protein